MKTREDAMLEAMEFALAWMVAAETELGGPLPVKYAANMQKPVMVEKLRAAIDLGKKTETKRVTLYCDGCGKPEVEWAGRCAECRKADEAYRQKKQQEGAQ